MNLAPLCIVIACAVILMLYVYGPRLLAKERMRKERKRTHKYVPKPHLWPTFPSPSPDEKRAKKKQE